MCRFAWVFASVLLDFARGRRVSEGISAERGASVLSGHAEVILFGSDSAIDLYPWPATLGIVGGRFRGAKWSLSEIQSCLLPGRCYSKHSANLLSGND